MALFYYWNGLGPRRHQKRGIRKWFWATSVGQRYSGAEFLRCVPADVKFFKKLAESPRTQFRYRPVKDRREVVRTLYEGRTGIGCAVYCMLLLRGPVSFKENGLNEIPFLRYAARANRKDRHHIFPRQVMSDAEESPSRYNSIVNICLLTAEENQQIGKGQPRRYLSEIKSTTTYFIRKMERHLIPCNEQSGIWSNNVSQGFRRFLKERSERICKALEDEAEIRLFRRDK